MTLSIDESVLRDLQTALAATTHTTVATIDHEGICRLAPTSGHAFGRLLAATDAGQAAQRRRMEAIANGAAETGDGFIEADESGLSHLVVPVVAAGRRLAVMVLGDRPSPACTGDPLRCLANASDVDVDALQVAANETPVWTMSDRQAAAALATVTASMLIRLCKQEHQLRARVDELSVIYDVADMLAGRRSLNEILTRTARKVCQVMQTKACSVRLLDEQSGELKIEAVYNLSQAYVDKGPVHVGRNPIDMEAVRGQVIYIEDVPNDPRVRYGQEAQREGIVSALICGMLYHGKPVGVIRVYTGRKHRFSEYESSLLRSVAAQAAAAIVNTRLYHAALEAERYERQLRYAGDVQRRMIPSQPPVSAGAVFGSVYEPSREVGGDFYDFIELPGGNIGIAIADVVGKGLPAALTMASLRAALRVYSYHVYDVDRIIQDVNTHLCRETRTDEFATVFYGVLTPDGRRLTYANAGHEFPLLLRDGKLRALEAGGLVCGVLPDAKFEKNIFELKRGDVLLLYTDGVVESLDFADQAFGRDRLRESFLRYGQLPPQQLAQNILWDVRRFVGLSERTDDVTIVAIRIE